MKQMMVMYFRSIYLASVTHPTPRTSSPFTFYLLLITSLLLFPALAQAQRPVVFVSIPPQVWLVKQIAGDMAEVQTLLPAGANPHTFEPTIKQTKKIAEASLLLTIGMAFERPLVKRAQGLNPKLAVAAMDAGIEKRGAHEHHHAPGEPCPCCGEDGDPHIWLSPRLYAVMATNTAAALSQLRPEARAGFEARRDAAVSEIQAVDADLRRALEGAPVKTYVVYHPSWTYFAEDYGLTLLVIEQDGKAPAAKHLTAIGAKAKAAGARKVLTEPQYDKRPAQAVAKQLGASVHVISPLQEDWPALMREAASVFK